MENKEFDRFIKSNTENDLTPPEALSWENMNIPLPQKKKKRGFYFFWLGLLGLILSGGYFIISPSTKNTEIDIVQNPTAISNQKNIELDPELTIQNKNLQQDIYKSENSKNKTTEVKAVKTKPYFNSQKNINQTSSKNISSPLLETKIINPILIDSTTLVNSESDDLNLTSFQIQEETHKEVLLVNSLETKFTFLLLPKIDTVKLNIATFFELPDHPNPDEEKSKKGISLYFSFGINQSKNNYSMSGNEMVVFQDFVKPAFGNGASLGLRFDLKKNIFLESGLSFQKLHATFDHSLPLGTFIDTMNHQKIYRTRHVFHNNYFSYLELNVGIGKTFLFGKNWGSEIVFRFNPSIKLKNEGKLLDTNSLIFKIEDFDATPKLFLSADVGLNLFYQIKNNKIFTGVSFKQNLSKLKFLDNSNLTIHPQILTIKLGMLRNF